MSVAGQLLVFDPVRELQRTVAFFAAALLLSTWPLWSAAGGDVVQIPWFSFLCGTSPMWDLAALVAVVCGLVQMGLGSQSAPFRRAGMLCFLIGLLVLVALDQHRLQPWVMQFLLFAALWLLAPDSLGISCWKMIVASIYLWSALSKFDVAFLDSHGQLLLQGLLQPLRIDVFAWPLQVRQSVAALFPVGELVIGLLLLVGRTRRYGLPASIAMHVVLIWTLGWGLRHEWSVLIWNTYFIVQNLLLFAPDCRASASSAPASTWSPAAFWFTALAATYPVLEGWGLCDHWPAWAVYSARPAVVRVFVNDQAAESLPEARQLWLRPPLPLEDRQPFSLDVWSFANCHCPVYPQLRYRLALTAALLEGHIPAAAVTVDVALTPDRWTGIRRQETLSGLEAVRQRCDEFWFNTRPR